MRSIRKRRVILTLAGMVLVAAAAAGMFLFSGAQAATAAFVQGRANEISSGKTDSVCLQRRRTRRAT